MIHLKYLARGLWDTLKVIAAMLLIFACACLVVLPMYLADVSSFWWLLLYAPVFLAVIYGSGKEASRGRSGWVG